MHSDDEDKIDLLDHGSVRLVDFMGSDLSIVRSARVSYDAEWRTGEDSGSDKKLIDYLWRKGHTTPFESVTFTFEVKAPIFIFRQWHRHRMQSYNETSARYTELPSRYYLPEPEIIGKQSKKNKQQRIMEELTPEELNEAQKQINLADRSMADSFNTYRTLLDVGWPRELARSVLPVATYSHMFTTLNLLNLLKFLTLRADEAHAQYEIVVYAKAMIELARKVTPVAIETWEKYKQQFVEK